MTRAQQIVDDLDKKYIISDQLLIIIEPILKRLDDIEQRLEETQLMISTIK